MRTRMSGGVGGEEPRGFPLSRFSNGFSNAAALLFVDWNLPKQLRHSRLILQFGQRPGLMQLEKPCDLLIQTSWICFA